MLNNNDILFEIKQNEKMPKLSICCVLSLHEIEIVLNKKCISLHIYIS